MKDRAKCRRCGTVTESLHIYCDKCDNVIVEQKEENAELKEKNELLRKLLRMLVGKKQKEHFNRKDVDELQECYREIERELSENPSPEGGDDDD